MQISHQPYGLRKPRRLVSVRVGRRMFRDVIDTWSSDQISFEKQGKPKFRVQLRENCLEVNHVIIF